MCCGQGRKISRRQSRRTQIYGLTTYAERKWNLHVNHVKAHRTGKEKKALAKEHTFVVEGNGSMRQLDVLRAFMSKSGKRGQWLTVISWRKGDVAYHGAKNLVKRKESKNVVRDCKAMAKEELWSGWNQVKEQVLGNSTGDTGRNRKEELKGKREVRQDFVTREAIWGKLFV